MLPYALATLFWLLRVSYCFNLPTNSSYCKAREASCILEAFGYTPSCVLASLSTCEIVPLHSALEDQITELKAAIATLSSAERPRNCADLKKANEPSGIYKVYPNPKHPEYSIDVQCNQDDHGGGWTVIQLRTPYVNQREDFARDWFEYVLGFGDLNGEFWLGLEAMHQLTSNVLMELNVNLEDFEGIWKTANYRSFHIGGAASKYRLNIGKFSDDSTTGDSFTEINKMSFTTRDSDNDQWDKENCAISRKSGWWYKFCSPVDLNGLPHEREMIPFDWSGIYYDAFKGKRYSLRRVHMSIRPAAYKP